MTYDLPQSFEERFEHYHLPEDLRNVGVMNDIHIPYHSVEAIDESLNYFVKKVLTGFF